MLPDHQNVILELKTGNQQAFEKIYSTHWKYLHQVAYRFTQSVTEADDLVQETFVSLWEKKNRLDEERPVRPYLHSILKHKIIDHMRKWGKIRQESFFDQISHELLAELATNTTEELIAYEELNEFLERSLDLLPDKSRIIFRMSRMEHKSNVEIAETLNISVKNVEYHINKSLKHLRNHLDPQTGVIYGLILAVILSCD